LCIAAAITYTIGKNAYGYKGLGDISVFVFFGLVGVLGTHFLMTKHFEVLNILPAISCGLMATGVLNLNNLRDIDNDRASGKRSIPVMIGFQAGKVYQNSLVIMALFSLAIYLCLTYSKGWQLMTLILIPLFAIHLIKVNKTEVHRDLDPFLKQLALLSLLTTVVFGISILI
ncbi:MAG: 1,4-dihydroxy-2-naphthoate octaprenyltransferase, partial [Opitutaceae bacterium]|nr:1,4-dihydroxy-2-naphthoate octaprenyltransferase [Cytophagales bacterium]